MPPAKQGSRVVAYLRVSTGMQEREGASLDQQERAVREYAERNHLTITEIVHDVVSGRKESLDRPELRRALGELEEKNADGILVWNLDRFSRNVRDASGLLEDYFGDKTPWRLISVTEDIDTRTAAGRLHLHLMLSVHQYEAERIAERIRAVKKFLAAQGVFCGGRVPYGYSVGPRRDAHGRKIPRELVPHEGEQAVIARVLELDAQGLSLRAIARELGSARARNGKPFHPMQIQRILDGAKEPVPTGG